MRRALLAILLVACTEAPPPAATKKPAPPPPKPPEGPVRTDSARYVFRYGFFGPEITIVTTMHAKDKALYVTNCNGAMSNGLERRVGDAWVAAWGAVTNSCLSEPIVIPAGGQRTEPIVLRPGAGAVIYPREARQLIEPGTYRVVWHGVYTSYDPNARPFGDEVPLEQRASAPFVVEGPPEQPASIVSIEPVEDSYVPLDSRVRVAFNRPVEARLFVDGQEMGTYTGDIAYLPAGGWRPGWHGVLVRVGNEAYSWAFVASAE